MTIGRIRGFVAHLGETNTPRSVASQVDMLYLATRTMMPKCDWTWLRAVRTRLSAAAPKHALKGPVITSPQLLQAGLALMDENQPRPNTAIALEDAVRYRDGLMFALTAFFPLRRKNLAALKIGRHLVREGDCWHILIPDEEMKMGASIAGRVPEILEPCLATYIRIIRPQLACGTDCDALWLNSKGRALAYAAIGDIFSSHSKHRIGIRITPHDVRDAAATTWALFAPDKIAVASELLAHTDERSLGYYNRARGIAASRAHNHLIAEMRRKCNRRRSAD
jgi:integrase